MATKTETKVVNEAAVKAAVQTWAKAEFSAIWSLIRVVSKGLVGFEGADRKTRISALKTWVNQAAEDAWGEGAAKDRSAHISKIFTIAENATEKHFERWAKAGTGFYRAYSEFAVPQRAKVTTPAASTSAAPAEGTGAGKSEKPEKPEVVKVTTTPDGKLVEVDSPAPSGEIAPKTVEGFSLAGAAAATPAAPVVVEPPADFTEMWAARIDMDKITWKRLVDHLTEKKKTIMEPDMVLQLMQAVGKKATLFRNTIAVLLQDPFIKGHVVDFIKENILMFDGLHADAESKELVGAEK